MYEDKGIHSNATTNYASPKFNLHHRFKHRKDVESARPDTLTSPLALSQSPLPRAGTDVSAFSPSLLTESSVHGSAEQPAPRQAHVEFEEKGEEEETPQLSLWMTIGLLVVVTVVRYYNIAAQDMCADTSVAGSSHRGMASGLHRRLDRFRKY